MQTSVVSFEWFRPAISASLTFSLVAELPRTRLLGRKANANADKRHPTIYDCQRRLKRPLRRFKTGLRLLHFAQTIFSAGQLCTEQSVRCTVFDCTFGTGTEESGSFGASCTPRRDSNTSLRSKSSGTWQSFRAFPQISTFGINFAILHVYGARRKLVGLDCVLKAPSNGVLHCFWANMEAKQVGAK